MRPRASDPKLVIVDDDHAVLEIVGRFAENVGFRVVQFDGGREALTHMACEGADVAVVDLRMPDVGGLDVLRAITDKDPDCQVILVGPTPSAERWLQEARWEGNVRELRNAIERACILAEGEFITERELVTGTVPAAPHSISAGNGAANPTGARLSKTLTRDRIAEVLQQTDGNKMTAARILGVSRRALYRLLERHGLSQ